MAKEENHNFHTVALVAFVLLMAWVIWYYFSGFITSMIRWLRVGEMDLLSLITDRFDTARKVLPTMQVSEHAEKLGPNYLDWPTLWNISVSVGDYMRWPTLFILIACYFWISSHAPHARFKNKYKLESLMKIQSKMWPVITPILNFNPAKLSARIPGSAVPANLPQFAESLTPDEWLTWSRIPLQDGVPEEEPIRRALIQQLGPRWEGLSGLKLHHRALLAAFALKGVQKRKESDDLLGEIAKCWHAGRREGRGLSLTDPVAKQIREILANKEMMRPLLEMGAKHAWRTTAMVGILGWAREQGGVLAPAQFIWLRGEDRALWYPMNNLGRRSYHAEAAGAMAHYMAEKLARHALPMPRVKTAIQPIIEYARTVEQLPPLSESRPIRQAATLKPAAAK